MTDATGDAAIRDHIRYCKRKGLRPRTITARHDALIRLRENASAPLLTLTRDQIEDYLDTKTNDKTRAVYLSHIASFFQWATEEDVVPADPTRKIVKPRVKAGKPHPIDTDDLRRALAHPGPPHVIAWLKVAAYAGLRACEIALIRAEDINRRAGKLSVPEGKGGGHREISIPPVLMAEFDKWPRSGWLWKPDGPWHYEVVSRLANKHLKDAGVNTTLHSLRHWYATELYRSSGHDLLLVQKNLGHASPTTTQVYADLADDAGKDAAALLPDLTGDAA